VLTILIVVISIYLVYRLIHKKTGFDEGFESVPYPQRDAFEETKNLPLKEYAIQGSINSAYDGNKITIEQLGKVIYAGCRFIDVNVFSTNTEELYVGFAVDNAPTLIDVSLPFDTVIQYINTFGFVVDPDVKKVVEASDYTKMVASTINKANVNVRTIQDVYKEYPLFLNIRLYRPPKSKFDIVGKIATKLKDLKRAHVDATGNAIKITQYTRLGELAGKVIITMDIENILQIYASPPPYDPNNIPIETREAIEARVNIKTGGDMWSTFYKYDDVEKNTHTPLKIMDESLMATTFETNALNMKLSYPYYTEDKSNPDFYAYLMNHQIQCVPHRFYIQDTNLAKYIELFKANKTPFLPLYHAYTYINKKANPLV
jgi:hypothetical protein